MKTPLYFAERLTKEAGGAKIYLKREDLNHTGAHKINNTIGQALLAVRMGKKKIVAETGAGQHGVATATVCALFDLGMCNFHGERRYSKTGTECFPDGTCLEQKLFLSIKAAGTLKDAVNEALRYWVSNVEDTHYILGSALGPHPFPKIVRDFQRVIGVETRRQIVRKKDGYPMQLLRALAAEVMRLVCSIRFWMMKKLLCTESKRQEVELRLDFMQLRLQTGKKASFTGHICMFYKTMTV